MEPYFILFGKEIPFYGVCWFLGIFIAAAIALLITPKNIIPRYDIVYSAVYSMISGTIGSKILFIIVSLKQIITLKLPFEAFLKGGFVFYGGLIGGAVGLFIYCKQFKLNFLSFADIYAVALPLGHSIGRIGCLISGCCYGLPYDGPFSIRYKSTYGLTPLNTPLFPIQLVESLLLFILFVILFVLYKTKSKQKGYISSLYMILYPILRFVLEFFRGDDARGAFLILTTSQWISVIIFILGILNLISEKNRH